MDAQNDLNKPIDCPTVAVQTIKNQRNCFIEIGTFRCGSIFGLGEQMEDRIITAGNKGVQCLLIPRYWLMQKNQNSGNIWERLIALYFYNIIITFCNVFFLSFFSVSVCLSLSLSFSCAGPEYIWILHYHRVRLCSNVILHQNVGKHTKRILFEPVLHLSHPLIQQGLMTYLLFVVSVIHDFSSIIK